MIQQPHSRESGRSSILFYLVVAVFCSAPFESLTPLLRLPVQKLSNLELLAGIAILAWAGNGLLRGRMASSRNILTVPLILLLLTMLLSSLLAGSYLRECLLFTGRLVVAVLFLHLVVDQVDTRRRVLILLSAILLAGTLVAVLGLLEYQGMPLVLDFLSSFQAGPSYAGSQIRVSSTLQYPTITSMVLEIVFALGMGLLLLALQAGKRFASAICWLCLWLVGFVIFLTLTRSGLASLSLALLLGGLAAFRWWGWDRRMIALGGLALALLLGLFATILLSEEAWLRLVTVDQHEWYQVDYTVPRQLGVRTGDTTRVEVELENTGLVTWAAQGERAVLLSYHWFSEDGSGVLEYEGLRTHLAAPVRPGEKVKVVARVRAPRWPGRYRLAWDLLQEDLFWFSRESAPSSFSRVEVSGSPSTKAEPVLQEPPMARFILSRPQLWRIAARMWATHPWLGVGPDNFRHLYGEFARLEIYDLTYHTHNLFIEFFVDTGLIGGLLFLWIVLRMLLAVGGLWKDLVLPDKALLLGIGSAVLVILAHGLLDYFLEFTPTYLMISGVFGLAAGSRRALRCREHC